MNADAEVFQQERRRLFGLAYRMLASAADAEDVVQEAWLRWQSQPRGEILNPRGFLTTVVTRLCLDQIKSARSRLETYPGVWLPEPLCADAAPGPEEGLERLESVSLAFLSLLQTLSPVERAVYVLAEIFDYPHAEVAAILERSAPACRQALRRARVALEHPTRGDPPAQRHRTLLVGFMTACRLGDVEALTRLLADDVESRADGGGYVTAATKPVIGVRAVSRLYAGLAPQLPPDLSVRGEMLNGWPTALLMQGGTLLSFLQLRVRGDRICRIDNVINPRKLEPLARSLGLKTMIGR